jgi:hypothetical protein
MQYWIHRVRLFISHNISYNINEIDMKNIRILIINLIIIEI